MVGDFYSPGYANVIVCNACNKLHFFGHNSWCSTICDKCRNKIQNPSHHCLGQDECYDETIGHDSSHGLTQCIRCSRRICLECPDYNKVRCKKSMGKYHCRICNPESFNN